LQTHHDGGEGLRWIKVGRGREAQYCSRRLRGLEPDADCRFWMPLAHEGDDNMRTLVRILAVTVPLALVGACTTLNDQDRALLQSASQNAADAKAMSQQALDAAKAAQQSADQAEAAAKEANAKADRAFQRSLGK
jgi:Alanine-zipper, major outer membrane lipoprotein